MFRLRAGVSKEIEVRMAFEESAIILTFMVFNLIYQGNI